MSTDTLVEAIRAPAAQDASIALLAEAVAIASVSAEPERRTTVAACGDFLAKHLTDLGFSVDKRDAGVQQLPDGKTLQLPPILLARKDKENKDAKTVVIYGHYDVQPAAVEDGWNTDPFKLTEINGNLYGRGSTDDKGPIIGWIAMLRAYKTVGRELPVNIRFCLEGMEESGSEGLDELIISETKKNEGSFFASADCVTISDNYWLGLRKPCLTYGLRGICYYEVHVKGPAQDLHSGLFGGIVHEPMTDLAAVMGNLVAQDGTIKIPGINNSVAPVTEDEKKLYDVLDFDIGELQTALGQKTNITDSVPETLMRRWRFPSLSLHGIQGAFSGVGAKTVIPAHVVGKFSIRIVPNQTVPEIDALVKKHVESEFKKLTTKNTVEVVALHGGDPWVADINHYNYRAAHAAIKQIWGVDPDYTREGGSIPVTLTFQNELKRNVLLLPMGMADDGAHSTNEKIARRNFIDGICVFAAYLEELAKCEKE